MNQRVFLTSVKRISEIAIISILILLILTSLTVEAKKKTLINNNMNLPLFLWYASNKTAQEEAKVLGMNQTEYLEYVILRKFGLNKPLYVLIPQQIKSAITYIGQNREYILISTFRTVLLLLLVQGFILVFGLLIGVLAGYKRDGFLDKLVSTLAPVSNGVPSWWIAGMLLLILSLKFNLFPASGYMSIPPKTGLYYYYLDIAKHLVLPFLALFLARFWEYAFIVRSLIFEEFKRDYILVAEAKGVPKKKILWGHALRNILPSFLTFTTYNFLDLLTSVFVIDIVFDLRGLGTLLRISFFRTLVSARGIFTTLRPELFLSICIIIMILYLVVSAILETLYIYLDPRIGG